MVENVLIMGVRVSECASVPVCYCVVLSLSKDASVLVGVFDNSQVSIQKHDSRRNEVLALGI